MNIVDFKDLSYVLAMAEHQNVTKAANSLFLSQPTLTKFIQNLEKNLEQKLFRKVGNKFLLTYAGERYVEHAKEILLLKKELDLELADIIKSNVGQLNVAYPAVRGTYMLPSTLPLFRERFPQVKMNITEATSAQMESMLMDGSIDLAFYNAYEKHQDIVYELVQEEEILMVVSNQNPVVERAVKKRSCKHLWLDIHLCEKEQFILQKPDQRTGQIVNQTLKVMGISPKEPLITSNIRAGAKLAAKNYGITFVCDTHLNYIDLEDVSFFSWGKPRHIVDFVGAYRKDAYLSYHAKEYLQLMKELGQQQKEDYCELSNINSG